jgi:osmoprotectant transport system permease protein
LSVFEFLASHRQEALSLVVGHVVLVGVSMLLAALIGIPLGIVITRQKSLRKWVLGAANIVQTVPSLALFGFLIPVPFIGGIGKSTAIVALTLYALLPIIRNTFVGITGVDPAILEAARGMGMTEWQMLRKVEIPLAMSVILAGLRVATVISVGIATIAAAIGAGGLGVYIFRGLAMVNNQVILAGAIPAAILAVAADLSLGWAERRLTVR